MNIQPITNKTSLVGLIGLPLEHSLSPVMQNSAFAELGMDWAYLPLPVQPGHVEEAVKGLVALNFVGSNVTIPHKETAMQYMDELSDAAQSIGAINTIRVRDGKLHGDNTDPNGFLNALYERNCDPEGMRVILMGAGGASRAVVYALSRTKAASVIILNDIVEQAEALVDDMAGLFASNALSYALLSKENLEAVGDNVNLVINATPVGMYPKINTSPWIEDVPMPNEAVYFDLVYNPLETVFLKRARAAGAMGISGLGMLVHQGARSFEIWTHKSPPVDIMQERVGTLLCPLR